MLHYRQSKDINQIHCFILNSQDNTSRITQQNKDETLLLLIMRQSHKLELPKDFAQSILDNEIEFRLAEVPTNTVICNLLTLYSQGLEYYESIKSYKFLYFKKKMDEIFYSDKKLFVEEKKETVPVNQSPIRKKMNSKDEAERIEALKFKEKQQKMKHEIGQLTSKDATCKEAQQIIKGIDEKEKLLNSKIKTTIEGQNSLLEQKLLVRKKKSFGKSFSAYGFTEGTETKESLFTNDANPNEKGREPLLVSFQSVIDENESDQEEYEPVQKKKTMVPRGKMASMGMLF